LADASASSPPHMWVRGETAQPRAGLAQLRSLPSLPTRLAVFYTLGVMDAPK